MMAGSHVVVGTAAWMAAAPHLGLRGLAAIHDAGGLTMVLTPGLPPQRGCLRTQSATSPIHLIGDPRRIAVGICAACTPQKT